MRLLPIDNCGDCSHHRRYPAPDKHLCVKQNRELGLDDYPIPTWCRLEHAGLRARMEALLDEIRDTPYDRPMGPVRVRLELALKRREMRLLPIEMCEHCRHRYGGYRNGTCGYGMHSNWRPLTDGKTPDGPIPD